MTGPRSRAEVSRTLALGLSTGMLEVVDAEPASGGRMRVTIGFTVSGEAEVLAAADRLVDGADRGALDALLDGRMPS